MRAAACASETQESASNESEKEVSDSETNIEDTFEDEELIDQIEDETPSDTNQELFTLTINGTKTYDNVQKSYSTGWYTYDLGEIINITSIQYQWSETGGYTLAAMMADGSLLVDSSAFNASQNWSQEGTIINPVGGGIDTTHPTYSPTNLYDGDDSTSWGAAEVIKSQTGISIPFTSTFTIKLSSNSSSNTGYLKIYGSNNTQRTIGNSN